MPEVVFETVVGDQIPVINSTEVVGRTGETSPVQILVENPKVGVTIGLTVIVNVGDVAQIPGVGVNVYVVVVALFKAGDQLPVIPLISVVGNALRAPPAQIGATGANSGVAFGKTLTVIVAVVAHCPVEGVNVYVVVAVVFGAGDHVPVIPFTELVGNVKVAPEQIGAIALKNGMTFGVTVTAINATVAH